MGREYICLTYRVLSWIIEYVMMLIFRIVAVVQSPSCVWLFVTSRFAASQASLSLTISQSVPKFICIESVMLSNYLILCCLLLLPPSNFSSIRGFSKESDLPIRWPKYWSFSFSISPSNGYSKLISFKIDWFDLIAIQGALKSLLQHHSSKHQFFSVLPSLCSRSHICTWLLEKP